jgi:hypothetical protein
MLEGGLFWLVYIALEPFVRKHWPEAIVSWSRLLAGRFRDPLVGRHLLFGSAIGSFLLVWNALPPFLLPLLGQPAGEPRGMDWDSLLGAKEVLAEISFAARHAIVNPMSLLFIVVLASVLTRRRWIAMVLVVILFSFLGHEGGAWGPLTIAMGLVNWCIVVVLLVRFGPFAAFAGYFIASELREHALTLDFATWYAGSTVIVLLIAASLAIYGCWVALAGRSILGEAD